MFMNEVTIPIITGLRRPIFQNGKFYRTFKVKDESRKNETTVETKNQPKYFIDKIKS